MLLVTTLPQRLLFLSWHHQHAVGLRAVERPTEANCPRTDEHAVVAYESQHPRRVVERPTEADSPRTDDESPNAMVIANLQFRKLVAFRLKMLHSS